MINRPFVLTVNTFTFFSQHKNESCEIFLRLSSFRRNEKRGLKVCDEIELSLLKLARSPGLCKLNIFISQCYEDKLYVFYLPTKRDSYYYLENTFENISLLVICNKKFSILKNQKLAGGNIRQDKSYQELKKHKIWSFETMCCSEEELFVKIRFTDSYSEVLLVFDMKKDVSYFQENFFPSCVDCKEQQLFAAGSLCVYLVDGGICSEIRILGVEDERLADGGLKWVNVEEKHLHEGFLFSACFV